MQRNGIVIFESAVSAPSSGDHPFDDSLVSLGNFELLATGARPERQRICVSASRRRSASLCSPSIAVISREQGAADMAYCEDMNVHEARARARTGSVQDVDSPQAPRSTLRETSSWDEETVSETFSGWGNSVKRLLAGAASAVISKTTVAPFERVRMDIMLRNSTVGPRQTAARVLKTEGLQGFWKGNLLNLMRNAPFKAVNFFAYDMFTKAFVQFKGGGEGQTERFLAGALAGMTAVVTCFPLDTIRTRLLVPSKFQYKGVLDCTSRMIKEEGFGSLYRGVPVSVLCVAPSSAVFYGVYHFLKHRHLSKSAGDAQKDSAPGIGVWHTLVFGAIAGASAEASLYPLEVIRRQMQIQQSCGQKSALEGVRRLTLSNYVRGMTRICADIARKQGVGGFYSGIMVNTLQVLPNAALSFFAYEAIKSALGVKD